jgi:hypothetical protein
MTRKDFELIAEVLKNLRRKWRDGPVAEEVIRECEDDFVSRLKNTNHGFNEQRFREACN